MKSSAESYSEPTFTKWFNPLDVPQVVTLWMEGKKRRIEWKPGETKELPSLFDSSINTVHNGVIVGGEARQLVNVSLPEHARPKLHEAWDSRLHEQLEAAARAAAAALHAKNAEDLALIAAARLADSKKHERPAQK